MMANFLMTVSEYLTLPGCMQLSHSINPTAYTRTREMDICVSCSYHLFIDYQVNLII